jgi:hypothetical protein
MAVAGHRNSVFDFAMRMMLDMESNVVGNPTSQLVGLLIGIDTNIPQIVNKLSPNNNGTMNLLFMADIPANKPNAKVTMANIPTDTK